MNGVDRDETLIIHDVIKEHEEQLFLLLVIV